LIAAEPRLQRRYQQLVEEHLGAASPLAAGLRRLPTAPSAFAATQAAWRFFHNPRLTLPQLGQPLLEAATAAAPSCARFALVVHDWSHLDYASHSGKTDRCTFGQAQKVGYELTSAVLLRDTDGAPLAPLCQSLQAADGHHSSRHARRQPLRPGQTHLDALGPTLDWIEQLPLGRPVVHLIDREGDSLAHLRRWLRRRRYVLVRADADRRVRYQGQEPSLADVVQHLQAAGTFRPSRTVQWHGRPAQQMVAETTVTLHRPAQQHRTINGRRQKKLLPGRPLTLRLVVSRVFDAAGAVVAEWLLLSNLPAEVSAAEVALWYYWRWRIESYFKLLKGAGQQLEHWQQETAAALARRRLVASMACVVVWQLARDERAEAAELRAALVRLSGRQMKRGRAFTEPALLAGLWVLLAIVEVVSTPQGERLRDLAQRLGLWNPPDSS
jgi:hypothetical protein